MIQSETRPLSTRRSTFVRNTYDTVRFCFLTVPDLENEDILESLRCACFFRLFTSDERLMGQPINITDNFCFRHALRVDQQTLQP